MPRRGSRRIIIGGFKFVTSGDSSRHGDVSRDDAVLEPPPVVLMVLQIGIVIELDTAKG